SQRLTNIVTHSQGLGTTSRIQGWRDFLFRNGHHLAKSKTGTSQWGGSGWHLAIENRSMFRSLGEEQPAEMPAHEGGFSQGSVWRERVVKVEEITFPKWHEKTSRCREDNGKPIGVCGCV